MADIHVAIFLQNLKELINSKPDLIQHEKDQLEFLHTEVSFLRDFLDKSEENRYLNNKVNELVTQIRALAREVENAVELFTVAAFITKDRARFKKGGASDLPPLELDGKIKEEMRAIKTAVSEISGKMHFDDTQANKEGVNSSGKEMDMNMVTQTETRVVGFDEAAEKIKAQMEEGRAQLEVIPIVGSPGAGKTTLAKQVFNDARLVQIFDVRAWKVVSQTYNKRDLIIGILGSAKLLKHGDHDRTESELGEQLKKRLKGKRYVVVLDDLWSAEPWRDLRRCFPDEGNRSRVIFTTRRSEVAKHGQASEDSHHRPPPLTIGQGWELLEQKVFGKQNNDRDLERIGREIVKKCDGLPLAIVVMAGVLAKIDRTPSWWKEVSRSLTSFIEINLEAYMGTIALSYNHLELHLKACFLFLGAFPEDYEIPVHKLTLLWIAEGFVQKSKSGGKSLEELANKYMADLIDRCLVMPGRRKANGTITTCHIHDLLRDFCIKTAEQENFLRQIYKDEQISPTSGLVPVASKQRRLSIGRQFFQGMPLQSYAPELRSLLCLAIQKAPYLRFQGNTKFLDHDFRLLRVLDLISISIPSLPTEMEYLIHLRYLAIWIATSRLPQWILNLWNLEILIIAAVGTVKLPHDIWKMVKLRHLYIKKGEYHIERPPSRRGRHQDSSTELLNLQTINRLCPCSSCLDFVLSKAPNLKKLGFSGPLVNGSGNLAFFDMGFLYRLETLNQLEALKLINSSPYDSRTKKVEFQPNVRSLTLKNTKLRWSDMSVLGELPNLEVLNLLDDSCIGPLWDTSGQEFSKLKLLRLQSLDITRWDAVDASFPNLHVLVLKACQKLEKIWWPDTGESFPRLEVFELEDCQKLKAMPSGLGDICCLRLIEVKWCSAFVQFSAVLIKEYQEANAGNDRLRLSLVPGTFMGKQKETLVLLTTFALSYFFLMLSHRVPDFDCSQ